MTTDERGVSPVVAAALLIGIVVILASVIGLAVLDLDTGPAESPEVTLSFEVVSGDIEMTHEGGPTLEAANVVIRDQDGNTVSPGLGTDLSAGQSDVIVDDASSVDEITVVWQNPRNDSETILATFKP
jgi:flagellin-like protein